MSAVSDVEDALVGLQVRIAAAARGSNELESVYLYVRKKLTAAKSDLEEVSFFDQLVSAIDKSESLARAGRFGEAENLILEASKTLMHRSGSEDRLRRLY